MSLTIDIQRVQSLRGSFHFAFWVGGWMFDVRRLTLVFNARRTFNCLAVQMRASEKCDLSDKAMSASSAWFDKLTTRRSPTGLISSMCLCFSYCAYCGDFICSIYHSGDEDFPLITGEFQFFAGGIKGLYMLKLLSSGTESTE